MDWRWFVVYLDQRGLHSEAAKWLKWCSLFPADFSFGVKTAVMNEDFGISSRDQVYGLHGLLHYYSDFLCVSTIPDICSERK
jgi:hypothetical protein